jgi:hypothetical protein
MGILARGSICRTNFFTSFGRKSPYSLDCRATLAKTDVKIKTDMRIKADVKVKTDVKILHVNP